MTDAVDRAQKREQDAIDDAVAGIRRVLTGDGAPCSRSAALAHHHVCEACGDEIEPERLQALPCARRCVECQTKFERGFIGRGA